MHPVKTLFIGLAVGTATGLWIGTNIGKDQSIFSNPFADNSLQHKIKQTGDKLMEKSGEAIEAGAKKLEKGGQALKEKARQNNGDTDNK
ncbi:MAG: hypothetical protein OEZ68_17310 [Gammaproteobacteria bacterium]|nr:hypothetical protein [Gammaproteobacteria bacterium]MDH5802562.1 hypothetical protein [Gammaproteobacteria bacterium]